MAEYTVSQDKNGYWYAHRVGYAYIPYFGSFTRTRRKALEFAASCMCMTYDQYMEHRKKMKEKIGEKYAGHKQSNSRC